MIMLVLSSLARRRRNHPASLASLGMMANVDALDQEQDIFGDVSGVVGDPFQISHHR